MGNVIDQILFTKQNKRFLKIEDIAKSISPVFSGNPIVRDSIFGILKNYARKKEHPIELLRYPFHDEELWAFTFIKMGTIFVCVNSELSMCKQIFATAHEFFHIYCFTENTDQNTIRNGSLLNGETVDSIVDDQEELEANAFAGLILMPSDEVRQQIEIQGIDKKRISIDDVLVLMDVFATPYKACVLRLYECGIINGQKAKELYTIDWKSIHAKISLTGTAKRWQLNGAGTELFGSLFEDYQYNVEHHLLTEARENSDRMYISSLKDRYNLDVEGI